jgi:selenium metabolism protein YedF
MKMIDVLGKPCPIPVIETRKALAEHDNDGVSVKTDNIAAVRNLEKMANSYGYAFSYIENSKDSYEVIINKDEKNPPAPEAANSEPGTFQRAAPQNGLAVVISRNTFGEGAEELGKILIKGFIYSLTELPIAPKYLIFINSGAYLTSDGANTIEDIKKLEEAGAEILTCGTCVNYYGLQDKLAVGTIANMHDITERMASAGNVINI